MGKGFTLIELLVVISIISILTVALLVTFNPFAQLQRGKDAQRKSDLEQLQRALESYYNDNNKYSCFGSASCGSSSGWAIASNLYDNPVDDAVTGLGPSYIKTIPKDPKYQTDCPGYLYSYSDSRQKYTLFAKLENINDSAATQVKPDPVAPANGSSPDGNKSWKIGSGTTCGDEVYNYWVNNP